MSNCRAQAIHPVNDRWYCDDCYEYLYLRLPDLPPLRKRIMRWFIARKTNR